MNLEVDIELDLEDLKNRRFTFVHSKCVITIKCQELSFEYLWEAYIKIYYNHKIKRRDLDNFIKGTGNISFVSLISGASQYNDLGDISSDADGLYFFAKLDMDDYQHSNHYNFTINRRYLDKFFEKLENILVGSGLVIE